VFEKAQVALCRIFMYEITTITLTLQHRLQLMLEMSALLLATQRIPIV
jgi:hypothetical protein